MSAIKDIEGLNIPQHVAIILDGNGRWAKKKMLPRSMGHVAGAKTVEQICEDASNLGIKYLTVYAFSTENWNRSEEEVGAIMKILRNFLLDCIKRANGNDMKVRVIGERSRLDSDIIQKIQELEEATINNNGLNFTIAINYGSRDEITRAIRNIVHDARAGKLSEADITEELINEYLDTAGLPYPDLLIRTSGEERLSNYLLWQLAYTEFYFTDVLWPDFDKNELINAIIKYNGRERRFGGRMED
ncbi:MAG: isoprenyl transferase [Eubacterium sp.]